jgi:ABC-type multidrug transport system fused ATPase/permease subunit
LDHLNQKSDAELWAVLEDAGLKDYILSLDEKLDAPVQEDGANFSVGQRQLLCLARAMLVRPKILLIDEATASVDMKTDTYIQRALRTSFKDATILCIAHRLLTIIDYDRVLVLQDGHVREFDTPENLVNKTDSLFGELVDETGPSSSKLLRKLAREGFGDVSLDTAFQLLEEETS